MRINPRRPVTSTVARAMFLILLLSVITTGFALFTLASSLSDAEAVNVSGSMRMQSYRLAYDIQGESALYEHHIEQFDHSLYSPTMKDLLEWDVPDEITYHYLALIKRWEVLSELLKGSDREHYILQVADFVEQIDRFVLELQRHSEKKLIVLGWVAGLGLGGILIVSLFVVHFVRKEIVRPLRLFAKASEQIKNRNFDIEIGIDGHTELSMLAKTFNAMTADLGNLYRGLEKAVDEKTHRLQHANQSLKVLYDCSQQLSVSHLSTEHFQSILNYLSSLEGIKAVRLTVGKSNGGEFNLSSGELSHDTWHQMALSLDGEWLGSLEWQAELPCPDQALINNVAQILARGIYYNRAQKQTEQLLLMEERATIARELHDSIAQSLSYLKIQVALLKRQVATDCKTDDCNGARQAIGDIDLGLSTAYTQLRELLSTFRLTIKEADFGEALTQLLVPLEEQTPAAIRIKNHLSSIQLRSNHQVHLLQLIREAVLNAVKHADANSICVECVNHQQEIHVKIVDDGKGFDTSSNKLNHYGLSIMHERASRLGGKLSIQSEIGSGCKIHLVFTNRQEAENGAA
ncbi:nitrate/nitrite two-component system sensor histidine kinase NarQ [Vibrio tapetis subsp. quintayensis]|uniref:nitrate/nitrite two-component system sensor histidine kinase NarQ n=1 Tax=Vibrio tapetis TaxID=52443 RepID=UPI0025B54BE5|nr:nitrate/nitrite two-component system sensor histidine kinase NarQ [Vibrio tapetis]MDN3678790.1 nitrate/nitrite two-component system sensor histidine kinase NarQ [Vibrio tapetis subsp. quintayensis]